MSFARKLTLVLAVFPTVALSGCLIGGSSKTEIRGTKVGSETIGQIQPGKTKSYVLALLGDPTTKSDVGNGGELWKWTYTEKKTSSGSVLFIFGGKNEQETTSTCYVEFMGDNVARAWRD